MTSYNPLKKNTAQRIVFPILDADGDPVTGATAPDTEYSLDGASFVDCTDEVHEIATASGIYYIDLTAGETNGDVVAIQCKTTTSGAKTTVLVFYTQSTNLDTVATYIDTEVSAIKAKTDNLPTDPADESLIEAAITAAHTTTNAKIDAVDDYVDTEVAAIKAVTDTLSLGAIADAVHDEVVEGTLTERQIKRLLLSGMAGKSAGGGTTTLTFKDNADTKARIIATVDADGNRTAVTLDGA